MKEFDITRPDKLILTGLKSLVSLPLNLYTEQKSKAKGSGKVSFIGEKKLDEVSVQHYQYNKDELKVNEVEYNLDFVKEENDKLVHWLNIYGLHDVEIIQDIGQKLGMDRITLRHVLDTTLRPKVEEFDKYLFFSIKSILNDEDKSLNVEQLSFILGKNYVVSFQEEHGDHFDHIRNKIEENLGLIRSKRSDFLVCQLLDAVLDNYYETIEWINTEVRELEKQVFADPTQELLIKMERMKQVTQTIKKSLSPFKDSLRLISNRESSFITKEAKKYFLDLMSSCNGAIEEINSTANSLESLTNIYFSSLSQKMNETMKVLTTVSTIFIPMTFIAGIYGMNFEYMPELKYRYGYHIVWGVMGLMFIGMFIYFKRRKWL
ncbi:magnesium/cobalt transporter CorA [Reichenbachiella agarivorans]|uniref:Magnesium transport protein CorA n=1 Tax=Reichenbachiella agarivorans TaxID=2979464 RepID=A0ABY6CS96_9BACT|nr:magnesium/cobalt transporter CorA [Reichenbachiella agarivorans]UXP33397.1 magnesium/cobalt transporter CorA [Reichenbachiella agarivorans]